MIYLYSGLPSQAFAWTAGARAAAGVWRAGCEPGATANLDLRVVAETVNLDINNAGDQQEEVGFTTVMHGFVVTRHT